MKALLSKKNLTTTISILSILIICTACVKSTRTALPEKYVDSANIAGIEQVRDWGETYSTYFQNDFIKAAQEFRKSYPELFTNPDSTIDILAISGGGSKGAYGIGLLKGWDDSGDLPIFRLVTGISTGALIAPFAFLGDEYLDIVAKFYTNVSDEDIYKKKSLTNIIYSDSLASSLPLQTLIRENINEELIKKVAEEHKKGRRLFIGTTNLDAKRLVIWNMGRIAEIGDERAIELFQNILLASAAVPVALPPVYISMVANGEVYDEMHVDGGTSVEVFFYGAILDIESGLKTLGIEDIPKVRLFIIRNSIIQLSEYKPVKPRIIDIASNAMTNLIGSQGIGDLYRIYTISQRDGFEFNLATLPDDYKYETKVQFDPVEMKMLYEMGYEAAKNGYPWKKYPPFYIK